MNTADPMNDQNDLGCLRIDISDYLMDDGANDTLLQPRIGQGISPDSLEISRERGERSWIGERGGIGGIMGSDFAFNLRHTRERFVPTSLQFASHKPVGRVGSVVLPEGAIGCIARRLEIALECLAHLIPSLGGLFLGG